MKIRAFALLLTIAIAGLAAGDACVAHAQGRPRPRPAYRTVSRTHHTSSNSGGNSDTSYKGFLELGYGGGVGTYRADQLDILTTHGVTVGNSLFLGVGTGVNILYPKENGNTLEWNMGNNYPHNDHYRYNNTSAVMIPVYADIKYNFGSGQVRPYIDLKGGAVFLANSSPVSIGDGWLDEREGIYFSPTVGINVPTSRRAAINIGLCYSLISQKYYYYDFYYDTFYRSDGIALHSIGVKMSIEW